MVGQEGPARVARAALFAGAALYLILGPPSGPPTAAGLAVEDVMKKYTGILSILGDELAARYQNLNALMREEACGCSYHMCGNVAPPGSPCLDVGQEDFTSSLALLVDEFLGCPAPGPCGHRRISMDHSGVLTPSDIIIEDPVLGTSVVEDICMTKGMEDSIKRANNFTGPYIDRVYFASARSGVLRKWPLTFIDKNKDGTCRQFDPRDRLWYKMATSEPKNVVILVEATSTMAMPLHIGTFSKSRWEVAKDTVRGLLATLDESSDHIKVVVFNSQTRALQEGGLMQATKEHIAAVNEELNNVTLGGAADTKVAFDEAFDMFKELFKAKEYLSRCQNIIVHIGDGGDCTLNGHRPCSLAQSAPAGQRLGDGILRNLNAVEERQKELELTSSRAAVFTLTMKGGEDSLARQLACRNGGVWFLQDGRAEPLNSMAAYFQFLAFSMEPRPNTTPFAVFTPLDIDYISLNNVSNVVYPIFVTPKCPDGSPSNGKLLIGVIGKDVTLRTFHDVDGLTEGRVRSMIDENLGSVRECDSSYKYTHCELQRIRGAVAECLISSWDPLAETKCQEFGTKHYLLEREPAEFQAAQQRCGALGGRLAELSLEGGKEEQHFLASIVPPDGAWIGLRLIGEKWVWADSMMEVGKGRLKQLWVKPPPKVGKCRAGFIDPRGTARNIGGRVCQEKMAFVCEFNATAEQPPDICKGQVVAINPEDLLNSTALACAGCRGHEEASVTEPVTRAGPNVICPLGDRKGRAGVMCCSEEEYKDVCPPKDVALTVTRRASRAKSLAFTISVSATLTALAIVVVLMELRAPGTLVAIYRKLIRWGFGKNREDPGSRKDQSTPVEPPVQLPVKLPNDSVAILVDGWKVCGAHGDVKEGVWLDANNKACKVAIKSSRYPEMSKYRQAIERELNILAKIPSHDNIVSVIGWYHKDGPVIVEELMATNLQTVLDERGQDLTYDEILRICLDVALGLDHLHRHKVTHFDIKPANILMDANHRAKLADFSCSELRLASSISACFRGTMGYIAPEIIEEGCRPPGERARPRARLPAEKIDVYSFGKVMLMCVAGDLQQGSVEQVRHRPLMELISDCISKQPKNRPDCQGIIKRLEGMLNGEGSSDSDWRGRRPRQDI